MDGIVNDTSTISVVMSVYNSAETLEETVASVLRQEGVPFEFIVVDDGSTDESPNILEDIARRDARVRVIRQNNAGLTCALIRGCAEARGRYIARQDSDDLSLPGRLAKQAALLDNDDRLVFVSSWGYAFGPERELLYEDRRSADAETATDHLLNHRIGPPLHGSIMMRRDAYEQVGGYRPEFYFSQDSDLWLRLGDVGMIAYVPEFLCAFRYCGQSISASRRAFQKELGALAHACQDARRKGEDEGPLLERAAQIRPPFWGKGDSTLGNRFIAGCLRARRDPRAARYYAKVLRQKPWSLSALAGYVVSKCRARVECAADVGLDGLESAEGGAAS